MPKTSVYFIDANYLKKNSSIQENVDEDILVPAINKAHDITIQTALGTYFFEHLKVSAKNDVLTPEEDELIRDYIRPVLVESAFYEAIPFVALKVTNKSVSTQNSEYSEAAELASIKYLRQTVRDNLDFYLIRLNEHLRLNYMDFPLYYKFDYYNNLKPNAASAFNGIHIRSKGRRGEIDKDCCPKYRY
jgi:hypothetical protein